MNHGPDGSSQELDQDGQPKHADDGLEDGSLVTRESLLEGGGAGGGNAEVQHHIFVFCSFSLVFGLFTCNTLCAFFTMVSA